MAIKRNYWAGLPTNYENITAASALPTLTDADKAELRRNMNTLCGENFYHLLTYALTDDLRRIKLPFDPARSYFEIRHALAAQIPLTADGRTVHYDSRIVQLANGPEDIMLFFTAEFHLVTLSGYVIRSASKSLNFEMPPTLRNEIRDHALSAVRSAWRWLGAHHNATPDETGVDIDAQKSLDTYA